MSTGAGWLALRDELLRWRDAGLVADFWWRDDDATHPTAALQQLLALSAAADVPLALAVIPAGAQPDLLATRAARVTVLQHGVSHRNLAPPGQKKSEFPTEEPPPEAVGRLQQGRQTLQSLFGAVALPVLVPPWNRIASAALLPLLAGGGYRGLSRFGARRAGDPASGLAQVNTHVDVIDWRGARGFVGVQAALDQALRHLQARRLGEVDLQESTGWLTHHAVHDPATWAFLDELFERTRADGLVVWRRADALFASP